MAKTNVCANCGETAVLRCIRCIDVWYCNPTCLNAHWVAHKKACNDEGLEKIIYRAGRLLQDVFFIFTEKTYQENVAAVEDKGNALVLYDAPKTPGWFFKFPSHMFANDQDRKMALSAMMCGDATGYFTDFTDEMLEGLKDRLIINEVVLKVKVPKRRVRVMAVMGECLPNEWQIHNVINIKKRDLTKGWILDPTGWQYNIQTPVATFEQYSKLHVEEFQQVAKWGSMKSHIQNISKQSGNGGLLYRVGWGSIKALNIGVDRWKKETGLSLGTLLSSHDYPFFEHRQLLLTAISQSLEEFVDTADYEADITATEQYESQNFVIG